MTGDITRHIPRRVSWNTFSAKVMASPKAKPYYPLKPGLWLGFFFILIFGAGAIAALWELYQTHETISIEKRTFGLDGSRWLAFLGGWGAILAAIATARITIRNAIKQHTINTLLQMRMSETYMQRAWVVARSYFPPEGIYLVRDDAGINPVEEDCLPELTYVINYLEFISSAIRYGDLDEGLMKESLRGLLCNLFECAHPYIQHLRNSGATSYNPLLFEHLEWLYRRWYIEDYRRKWLIRQEAFLGKKNPSC